MVDEYIRLDTTIIGIDGLINEAPTGSQARALFCAKDMIYDQQRYVSEMKTVKHGRWIYKGTVNSWDEMACSCCDAAFATQDREQILDWEFCPHCGTDMRGDENA